MRTLSSVIQRSREILASAASSRFLARALSSMLLLTIGPTGAHVLPLTPFRYEDQAQRHCPNDTVVWLDFRKEFYYLKRQRLYGQGWTGSFVCRKEGQASGFRRSVFGLR